MKFRLGMVLCWCLIMAGNAMYSPSRSWASLLLLFASRNSPVPATPESVFTLPVRFGAGFQLRSTAGASSNPLSRAQSKSSAVAGGKAGHSHTVVRPQRYRKRRNIARSRAAGSPMDPDQWVNSQVNVLLRAAKAAYENDEAEQAYEKVLIRIVQSIESRKLAEDTNFAARFPAFLGYVKAASVDLQSDHELGFLVPDQQYFAETRRYVQIPEIFLNQDFLRWVSRSETLDRAKAFLRELNRTRESSNQLIFFSYKSRHLGTPDNDDSYRRLLIVVPGNAEKGVPEKWVQFGVTDPRVRTRTRNVSVVSAVMSSDGTYLPYFKDYYRTYDRDGSIKIGGRWELGFGDDNCAKCHKSGILPIFPVAGSVSQDELPAVETVNERFRSYGSPRFDKYLDPATLGPGLGSASEESRSQRFGQSFDQTEAGHSMTCSICHQAGGLGSLNWPMDRILISSYVKGGQMPFGSSLTTSQRGELYEKLIQEYFSIDETNPGILKLWLLGKPRPPATP